MDKIEVRGARTHNLKNINLVIPRDKLIVVTGLSGSGKSSLAFDTLYAEGQRRYVESLSAYARQFLSLMEKPDVDHIEGLSPAISIEQKSTSHNPRSTVGTITEIHDYLRLLFARVGEPRCPDHDVPLAAQTVSQMVDNVLSQPEGKRLMLLAPIIKERKGEHTKTLENLASQRYIRARIDGEVCDLSDPPKLELQKKHTIEVVVDRFKVRDDLTQRLAESFETIDRRSLVVLADYVTLEAGTGCVHTAPGHGADDFETGVRYNLPIICPVDGSGKLTAEAGADFAGMFVFDANVPIIKYLAGLNRLFGKENIRHQYAHCWRCKNPIIYRATEQWFASVDGFREEALNAIANDVQWIPSWGEARIHNMVADRHDWCISRQRVWGVPIPIFYCEEIGRAHV